MQIRERYEVANLAFNSTRYIRNAREEEPLRKAYLKLSTPHGTLGTLIISAMLRGFPLLLSTPHGTLGTEISLHGFSAMCETFNSTRYIRNYALQKIYYPERTPFNSTRYIRNPKRPH